MAIHNLPPETGAWLLTQAERLASTSLHPEDLSYLRSQLADEETHPPEKRFLVLTQIVLDHTDPSTDSYRLVDAFVSRSYFHLVAPPVASLPTAWRMPAFSAPVIVAPSEARRPEHIIWSPEWEKIQWWGLSDEASHPYHFWHERPMDALVAVGGFQGYNLVNPHTQALVLVDYDARQLAVHTVFGGLILASETPSDLATRFLDLHSPAQRLELARTVGLAEAGGLMEPGRRQFVMELMQRESPLSLQALQEAYAPTLEKWRKGEPLSPKERATFDWLMDPFQYETVRRQYTDGRVHDFQANLFEPNGLQGVRGFLHDRHHRISQMYLSDPQDLWIASEEMGRVLTALEVNLRGLPTHEGATVQWTMHSGIPKIGRLTETLSIVSRQYVDPQDGKYAYVEMPWEDYLHWLPQDHFTPPRAERAFLNLNHSIRNDGLFMDGKLWLSPQAAFDPPDALRAAASDIITGLSFPDGHRRTEVTRQRTRLLLSETLSRVYNQEGEGDPFSEARHFLRSVYNETNTRGRGHLMEMLHEIDIARGIRTFGDREFDPIPLKVRQIRSLRTARHSDGMTDRFTELHHRRRHSYAHRRVSI